MHLFKRFRFELCSADLFPRHSDLIRHINAEAGSAKTWVRLGFCLPHICFGGRSVFMTYVNENLSQVVNEVIFCEVRR